MLYSRIVKTRIRQAFDHVNNHRPNRVSVRSRKSAVAP
jgi:hypothetical protein